MAIRQSIKELIGNTPLVQLNQYAANAVWVQTSLPKLNISILPDP